MNTRTFRLLLTICLIGFITQACEQCYTCETDIGFGPVEKELCGKKKDVTENVQNLETTGWSCSKN